MWADNETSEDLLGFQVHADLIRAVVTDPKLLPTTIGLFGDWGSGKTSIMRMLEDSLRNATDGENEPKVLCLYFNGWLFEGYEDAKAAMLGAIVRELANHRTIGNRIKDVATELLQSIDWMRLVRSGTKNIAVPVLLALASGGATLPLSLGAAALKTLSSGDEPPSEMADSRDKPKMSDAAVAVRTFRERFGEMISKTGLESLVILIDDLDRCTPERIIASLEAIKLFLNVEGTAFVIGADERIVRRAIAASYSEANRLPLQDDDPLVRDYLEKLVQVPYHIPRMSPSEVESYMVLLFCKRHLPNADFGKCLSAFQTLRKGDKYTTFGFAHVERAVGQDRIDTPVKSNLLFCGKAAPLVTECLKGNPRQIKRFLNAYVLRKQLANAANLDQLRDDVLLKLMILEYMKLDRFRELSNLQAAQDGRPKQLQKMEKCLATCPTPKDALDEVGEVLPTWKSEDLAKWLSLDPHLAGIDLRDYFWIARDKLQTTLSGVILLPPEIRRLFEDLLSGTKGREAAVTGEVQKLEAGQREDLLGALEKHIVVHPDERHAYFALARLTDSDIEGAVQSLAQGLEQVSPTSIPQSVFPRLLQLENQSKAKAALQGVLAKLREEPTVAKLLQPRKSQKTHKR